MSNNKTDFPVLNAIAGLIIGLVIFAVGVVVGIEIVVLGYYPTTPIP